MISEQDENLSRVHSKIAAVIIDFCTYRASLQFHMAELVAYVQSRSDASPDSPSRILRELRRQGVIDYRVISRSRSLYELVPVAVAA